MSFDLIYSIIVPTVTLAALLFAGIEDILYREVRREIVWVVMIIVGLVMDTLYVINAEDQSNALLLILISIVLGFLIGFILFYLGVWGGADTKAIWALSILTPVHPLTNNLLNITLPDILIVNIIDSMVFSLLLNAGIIAIFYPLVLMVFNAISASKESLFNEVRGTTSQKVRCFLFGYKKSVNKVDPKKLHYDFLEELSDKEFTGNFEGNFDGRLDGKFIGIFDGELLGEFTGKAQGIMQIGSSLDFEDINLDIIIAKAEKIAKALSLKKEEDDDEEVTALLLKYRKTFTDTDEPLPLDSQEYIVNINGSLSNPLKGYFIGTLEGIFEGKLSGKLSGKLTGDFEGQSTKGKMDGNTVQNPEKWRLRIRMSLDDDEVMEQRQLRTLWQLRKEEKKSVWVTPGLPFVSLMFLGYIQYLLYGNLALLLFTL